MGIPVRRTRSSALVALVRLVAIVCTLISLVAASALGRDALALRLGTLAAARGAFAAGDAGDGPALRGREPGTRLRVRSAGVLRPAPADADDDVVETSSHDGGDCHPFARALTTIPSAVIVPERVDELLLVVIAPQTLGGVARDVSSVGARGPPTKRPLPAS